MQGRATFQGHGGRPCIAGCLLALLLLLAAAPAWAGGFHISILGVRRTGMMTNLANPDDTTALFHNPAALADQPGTRLHLSSGMTFLQSDFNLQALDEARFPEVNPRDCGEEGKDPCLWPVGDDGYYEADIAPERYFGIIPYIGFSQGLEAFSDDLEGITVSLAAYAPGAYGAFLPRDAPTAYYITDGLFVVASTTLGAGWRINDFIAVGANVSYNYMRLGYAQKYSTADLLTAAGEKPGTLEVMAQRTLGDLLLDYTGVDHGFGWGVGVLVNPTDWLAVGLGYSGWTSATFEGDVTLESLGSSQNAASKALADEELRKNAGGLGYKLPRSLEVDMAIPPAFMAGLGVRPTWWLELGFDLRWWFYSIFEEQRMAPGYDPDDKGEEPISAEALSKDKNYKDSFEVAFGALFRPFASYRGLELMAGVAYDRSPVPDETFSIDNPSMNQAIVSAGIRNTFGEHWRVGLAYMLINYLGRDVTTSTASPPVNVRVRGRSHIPTLEVEYIF